VKKCGLVIRVSTDRQAKNEEGSLTTQLQRLRAHIEYKNMTGEERWVESERYVLKAVSGKDSFRSREFARLFEDIRLGKVNTVLCTALDRISRSVKDFLNFFEILNQHNVEFVCLKQNYDTTSAHGRLFITVVMALAEFEREQTSERTRDATLARAERGLWNGGHLLGYDTDPAKKGYLIPNEGEAAIVNFAFDTYLKCGSVFETAKELNRKGYRMKEYTSRRGIYHPPQRFTYSGVHWMLTNMAYIGKKEVNKKRKSEDQAKLPEAERYRVVKAVWPAIVDEEKFHQVQRLLAANDRSNGNRARAVRHNYILNSGLLWCGKCGAEMEGICGTGSKGIKYYYYRCKNRECRFKVPAGEIEGLILGRLKELALREDILAELVTATNEQLHQEMPQLLQQKALLQRELTEVKNTADGLMSRWATIAGSEGDAFLKEKLDSLAKRRRELEEGIASLEVAVGEIERDAVSRDTVKAALEKMDGVFASLQPHQQKELVRLVLHKAVLSEEEIKIALYGRPPEQGRFARVLEAGNPRSAPLAWLPRPDSNLTFNFLSPHLPAAHDYPLVAGELPQT